MPADALCIFDNALCVIQADLAEPEGDTSFQTSHSEAPPWSDGCFRPPPCSLRHASSIVSHSIQKDLDQTEAIKHHTQQSYKTFYKFIFSHLQNFFLSFFFLFLGRGELKSLVSIQAILQSSQRSIVFLLPTRELFEGCSVVPFKKQFGDFEWTI